ncbi:hypothetical protein ACOME3_004652 [Neoechinorhynchus agilis]
MPGLNSPSLGRNICFPGAIPYLSRASTAPTDETQSIPKSNAFQVTRAQEEKLVGTINERQVNAPPPSKNEEATAQADKSRAIHENNLHRTICISHRFQEKNLNLFDVVQQLKARRYKILLLINISVLEIEITNVTRTHPEHTTKRVRFAKNGQVRDINDPKVEEVPIIPMEKISSTEEVREHRPANAMQFLQ